MHWLHKFFRLPRPQRRLLLQAVLVVVGIQSMLRAVPFQKLHALVERSSRPARTLRSATAEEIGWAVTTAARYVPGAMCLTQALAALWLLRRTGRAALLQVGVARNEDGSIKAHAWLESEGQIVVGGGELHVYTTLPALRHEA